MVQYTWYERRRLYRKNHNQTTVFRVKTMPLIILTFNCHIHYGITFLIIYTEYNLTSLIYGTIISIDLKIKCQTEGWGAQSKING